MPDSSSDSRSYGQESQSVTDIPNEFFACILGPTMADSCAYFEEAFTTLDDAQFAKFDLALSRLDLQPGMTLLDLGCGWGPALRLAADKYDVNVIGITRSRGQYDYCTAQLAEISTTRSIEVRLLDWDDFHEPVDRIVSVGAFEAIGKPRYEAFFARAYRILPDDGRMLLQTILSNPLEYWYRNDVRITMDDLTFVQFLGREIFAGGELPSEQDVVEYAHGAGFALERVQFLRPHYIRTLEMWAARLDTRRGDAVAIAGNGVYQRYVRYLTGLADFFRRGVTDVGQFTLVK